MAKREIVREEPEPPMRREPREGVGDPPIHPYPKMKYHPQLRGCIVQNAEEEAALPEGWVDTLDQLLPEAPAVTALAPATVVLGAANFLIHVHGAGFAPDAVIVFNGFDEPTTVVSDEEVTTGVNMAVWAAPAALPVLVRNGDGQTSNSLTFTFTAESPAAFTGRRR